jgi:alkylation response protein AidB-like acyl-CoA dehydrogenase
MIEGSDPPRLVYALLDRSAFVIVDNWDTIGMRGTGSKRVAADGVFVPNLRTITAPGTSDEVPPG